METCAVFQRVATYDYPGRWVTNSDLAECYGHDYRIS